MLKLNNTNSQTVSAGSTVALNQVFNTNTKLGFNNNATIVRSPGLLDITGVFNLVATAASSTITLQMYADGTAIDDAIVTVSLDAIGDAAAVTLHDIVRVIPASLLNGYANITFKVDTPCTISSANVTFVYV